jgi:sensor histidine kinase YesM
MRKKISAYWKCQITGWLIYSVMCYFFGMAVKIDYLLLLKAISQFTFTGLLLTHLMRMMLLKWNIFQKPVRIQGAALLGVTLLFSILFTILVHFTEFVIGFYKVDMDAMNKLFVRTSIAFISLLIWNLIYFIYHYVQKSHKEQLDKIHLENELKIQHLESERTKAEFQQQRTELEMQALRAQMNPHFIFNSLNSINRFILQNNKAQASEYLTKFSKLVRMILQNSQASLISLESELEALKLYLDLEALRFEYHFTYNISVPKDLDIEILKVPPLITQPYAENAIWHGLMHKEEKGHLDIEVVPEKDNLLVKITDDGIGRKHASELASKSATRHKSMGLKITADRIAMLQRMNGNESLLTINDLANADGSAAGTEVIIKIPVLY